MSKVEIKLNSDGIQSLLKSEEVSNYVEGIARERMSNLSGAYEVSTQTGQRRAQIRVKNTDNPTFYRNLKNNELLKAFSS